MRNSSQRLSNRVNPIQAQEIDHKVAADGEIDRDIGVTQRRTVLGLTHTFLHNLRAGAEV